jgi:hypothetical protein
VCKVKGNGAIAKNLAVGNARIATHMKETFRIPQSAFGRENPRSKARDGTLPLPIRLGQSATGIF